MGEDIELSLMLLANYSATTNFRGETPDLSEAYQQLGLLSNIATTVLDAHRTRFEGATDERKRVYYNETCAEAKKVQHFLKHFILTTARKGLLVYTKPKEKKAGARASAVRRSDVDAVDLDWEQFANASLNTVLKLFIQRHPKFHGFGREVLDQYRDRYCFDDAVLDQLPPPAEESSGEYSEEENLPLAERYDQMEVEALEKEPVSAADAPEPPTKRRRGRPRKEAPAAPVVAPAPTAQKAQPQARRKRGRPVGSRNKKPKGHARVLRQDAPQRRPAPAALPSTVFDADDDDRPYAVPDRFAVSCSADLV